MVAGLMAPILLNAQHSLTGKVSTVDGTPLRDANVFIPSLERGTSTAADGSFSLLNLPAGPTLISISHLGYQTLDTLVTIPEVSSLDIRLAPTDAILEQIALQARAYDSGMSRQAPLSTTYISRLRIEQSHRMLGEADLIRIIQEIPGVKAESDYSGGFHVRGGRNDQNLILLDGMPVYNPWHMFGIFSALNADAVSGVEFNKGVFPAMYGGRLSSVLNVMMTDGENVDWFDQLNIGLLSSTLSLGGKPGPNTSVYLTARRTYIDPFLRILDRHERKTDLETGTLDQTTSYYFWDTNAKVVHQFNDGLQADLLLFYSNDRFGWQVDEGLNRSTSRPNYSENRESESVSDTRLGWDNLAASLRFSGRIGETDWSLQGYTTRFRSENTDISELDFEASSRQVSGSPTNLIINNYSLTEYYFLDKHFNQRVTDLGLKFELGREIFPNLSLYVGGEHISRDFKRDSRLLEIHNRFEINQITNLPTDIRVTGREIHRDLSERIRPVESAGYLMAEFTPGIFRIFPGIRFERYKAGNSEHTAALPRINLGAELDGGWYISAGFGRFRQYFQAIGFDTFRFPVESWFWPNEGIKPVDAETWTLGIQKQAGLFGFVTIEGYYRTFKNLSDIDPVESFKATRSTGSLVPAYRNITVSGEGESYGIETSFDWRTGTWAAHVSYTYSHSRNRFGEINQGEWFPSRHDSPHDLNINLTWNFSDGWITGMNFGYKSGQPVSMALTGYDREDDPFNIGGQIGSPPLIWDRRNNYRLPDYHRLDLFVTRHGMNVSNLKMDATFSVINVYNRLNVFAVNNTTEFWHSTSGEQITVIPSYRFLSQLPILPMINLRIRKP